MVKSKRSLILIRHAHRDNTVSERDNGLSDKGKEQALRLSAELTQAYGSSRSSLISSPKLRCVETLQPVAKTFGVRVKVDPLLLEQGQNETEIQFHNRIKEFLNRWKQEDKPITTFICSHGDWLPIATDILVGTPMEFKKGGWTEVAYEEGRLFSRFKD